MATSLVCFPFAHKELGSISSEMLFILWGTLAHRRINVGYFMIKNLERHARKKSGKRSCGGVVTALALHLDLSVENRFSDGGSCVIDWDILKNAGMVTVDSRRAGYFVLDEDIFFRFPSSQLTAVGGWTYKNNWKMNTQAHLDHMACDQPQGRGSTSQNLMRFSTHHIPRPEIHVEPLPTQEEEAEEQEEEEEEEDEEEAESSQPKRSHPVGRPYRDRPLSDIASGIQRLQLGQDNQWEYMRKW